MENVSETEELSEDFADDPLDHEQTLLRYRPGASRARQTLSAASRLLRKKIPQSGHLMIPKRLWMQTVPTQDCDVIIVFSANTERTTVNWLIHRIKTKLPELLTTVRTHQAVNSFAIYISSSPIGLLKAGEEMRISKKTKLEFGNGSKEFSQSELNIFQGIEDPTTFFTTQERQSIILHLLHSIRAIDGDEITTIKFLPEQSIVSRLQVDGLINQIFPLHDRYRLECLKKKWVSSFFKFQPLDEIYEYFGSKIVIYFSWLGYYTASLVIPAVIGIIFWIKYWWWEDQTKQDKAFVALALLNVLWGSAWLEAWKRRSAELSYKWGTLDSHNELLDEPRPLFRGDLVTSPVTGRVEPFFPSWKRNVFRYFVTVPLMFLCIVVVCCVLFLILGFQGWWDNFNDNSRGLVAYILRYTPKIVSALVISVFDEILTKIAVYLNDQENYRTENECYNNVIIKIASLRVVNAFFVPFYIAFYLQDIDLLKGQVAALFITRLIVGKIKQSCIPYIKEQFKLAKLSFDLFGALSPTKEYAPPFTEHADKSDGQTDQTYEGPWKSRIVGQAEVEANMSKYDGTCEDYLEMLVQFGYVMFFSSAFPPGAAFAFLANLVEIRSDAFKLCSAYQRPFGQRVKDIGVWQDLMELMCILGIIVNCMLIGTSGQVHRMFPEMSTTQTILLIVVLEHIMIALKCSISYAIPDIPAWVAQQIAKAELTRREALKKISSPPNQEIFSGDSSPRTPLKSSTEYVENEEEIYEPIAVKKSIPDTVKLTSVSDRPRLPSLSEDEKVPLLREHSLPETHEVAQEARSTVTVSRSSSACDKDKIPKSSNRWHHKYLDNSKGIRIEPLRHSFPAESLPVLSAPATANGKKSFTFTPEAKEIPDKQVFSEPEHDYESSKSSDSENGVKKKDENIHRLYEEIRKMPKIPKMRPRPPGLSKVPRKTFTSVECLPLTAKLMSDDTQSSEAETDTQAYTSKPVKARHPTKFLKRAQSFSQAIKKITTTEKKKKPMKTIKDDYSLMLNQEPMGELALVPLEKLVSIDDLKSELSSSNGK